jgi:peptidoglycan/LPS O-acetylase OafA/YrhL
VILDHLFAFATVVGPRVSEVCFQLGMTGVRYFFVLSGLVITQGLLREQGRFGRISLRGFWIRRAWRILPAFWAYLLAVAGAGALHLIITSARSGLRSALFVADVLRVDWFHAHIWTLSVEEQFYIVGPVLAVLLLRGGRRALWPSFAALYFAFLFWHRIQQALAAVHIDVVIEFISDFRFIASGAAAAALYPWMLAGLRRLPGSAVLLVCLA